jgi:hypothetical protein
MLCMLLSTVLTRTSLTSLWNIGNLSRNLSSGTSVTGAADPIAPTQLLTPPSSLRLLHDQGVPLPQSPPWSPVPRCQMVERTQKKSHKSPMTRTGQRCRPSDKSRQVRMKLKVEVVGLQDRYGFALVSAALTNVKWEMYDTSGNRASTYLLIPLILTYSLPFRCFENVKTRTWII